MTALDRAIRWKRAFIRDMLNYLNGLPAPNDHEKQLKETLEKERTILAGADKGKAYETVRANLRRWLKAAEGNLETSVTADQVVTWRREVRERKKLLDDLIAEGPP